MLILLSQRVDVCLKYQTKPIHFHRECLDQRLSGSKTFCIRGEYSIALIKIVQVHETFPMLCEPLQ